LKKSISFIGTVGIPNRYGGFEAFLEHCAPEIAKNVREVNVTCFRGAYSDLSINYLGVNRVFLRIPANGAWSILHDLVAFLLVFVRSSHIVVLGVSGGLWFPFFRLFCGVFGKQLLVNIDGVEWKRSKFSFFRRLVLRIFDFLAQLSAHKIIYDNSALLPFVLSVCRHKALMIPYSGDHVIRLNDVNRQFGTALTICRIEPENNIEIILKAAVTAQIEHCTIVGNWTNSDYGNRLRGEYINYKNITLLDPIYDPLQLAKLRESCNLYIHGHSVGGTNPSLVEMLFYNCRLLCFDVPYHHETAGSCAEYFSNVDDLVALLNGPEKAIDDRAAIRARYLRTVISTQYLDAAI
jgi:hypothetical protein